jgi:hypothetical protein
MFSYQTISQPCVCSIVFGDLPPQREMEPGSLKGLQLVVADAAAAREELLGRGVEVTDVMVITEADGGTFFGFHDPDDNSWAVQEIKAREHTPLIPKGHTGAGAWAGRDPGAVAATYFEAWKAGDWTRLRSVLADDVTFRGPLASIEGADTCLEGLRTMAQIMTDIVVHKRFVDGPDVLTWFDLHTSVADPAPTANWSHVEDGAITAIQVTFDARPLAPPGA